MEDKKSITKKILDDDMINNFEEEYVDDYHMKKTQVIVK